MKIIQIDKTESELSENDDDDETSDHKQSNFNFFRRDLPPSFQNQETNFGHLGKLYTVKSTRTGEEVHIVDNSGTLSTRNGHGFVGNSTDTPDSVSDSESHCSHGPVQFENVDNTGEPATEERPCVPALERRGTELGYSRLWHEDIDSPFQESSRRSMCSENDNPDGYAEIGTAVENTYEYPPTLSGYRSDHTQASVRKHSEDVYERLEQLDVALCYPPSTSNSPDQRSTGVYASLKYDTVIRKKDGKTIRKRLKDKVRGLFPRKAKSKSAESTEVAENNVTNEDEDLLCMYDGSGEGSSTTSIASQQRGVSEELHVPQFVGPRLGIPVSRLRNHSIRGARISRIHRKQGSRKGSSFSENDSVLDRKARLSRKRSMQRRREAYQVNHDRHGRVMSYTDTHPLPNFTLSYNDNEDATRGVLVGHPRVSSPPQSGHLSETNPSPHHSNSHPSAIKWTRAHAEPYNSDKFPRRNKHNPKNSLARKKASKCDHRGRRDTVIY